VPGTTIPALGYAIYTRALGTAIAQVRIEVRDVLHDRALRSVIEIALQTHFVCMKPRCPIELAFVVEGRLGNVAMGLDAP